MKLHQIISTFEDHPEVGILTETLYKYRRSLYVYYRDYFTCEPVLMVTDVMNAAQYARIVPANDYYEAVEEYLDTNDTLTEEDRKHERENINFNSIMLKDF